MNQATADESGREPVSGVAGAGTVGEPYDQGNSTDPNLGGTSGQAFTQGSRFDNASTGASSRRDEADPSTSGGYDSTSNGPSGPGFTSGLEHDQDDSVAKMGSNSNTEATSFRAAGEADTATGATGAQGRNVAGDVHPHHDTDKTGVTDMHSNDPNVGNQKPSSSNAASGRGTVGAVGVADSSVSADPRIGQNYKQKQQGADRPNEKPSDHSVNAVRERKARAEDVAGGIDRSDHAVGPGNDGPQTESKGEGTGEQWVKTTGTAAEGGNFDAAKPGAGREADRLLEQRGIQRTSEPKHDENSVTAQGRHDSHGSDSADKHGVGEKIKEKLHMGHHKE